MLASFAITSTCLWAAFDCLEFREKIAICKLEAAGAEVQFVGMTSSWSESIWMGLMLDSDAKVQKFRVRYNDVIPGTLQHLLELSEVIDLSVGGSQLSDSDLRIIGQLKSLQRLRIGNWKSTQITDGGVKWLSNLTDLRNLHLNAPRITDAAIEHLSCLTNLHSLSLTNSGITDAVLPHIFRLRSLQTLGLNAPGITDAGIHGIECLPELSSLDIRGANISGAGLNAIANSKLLTTLYIFRSQISDSGPLTPASIQQLCRRLPNLRVRN